MLCYAEWCPKRIFRGTHARTARIGQSHSSHIECVRLCVNVCVRFLFVQRNRATLYALHARYMMVVVCIIYCMLVPPRTSTHTPAYAFTRIGRSAGVAVTCDRKAVVELSCALRQCVSVCVRACVCEWGHLYALFYTARAATAHTLTAEIWQSLFVCVCMSCVVRALDCACVFFMVYWLAYEAYSYVRLCECVRCVYLPNFRFFG